MTDAPEKSYLRPCCVCSSPLNVIYDPVTDDVRLRPENLPPLVKDRLSVVAAYKRIKGLGGAWEKAHGPRGIVYASELLESVGFHGGQLDRALALLEWLSAEKKDFNLETAPTYVKAYEAEMARIKAKTRSRCSVCAEEFTGAGDRCPRHEGI